MVLTKNDILESESLQVGTKLEESIYILHDGTLIDGCFDYGSRCVEHREIEEFTNNLNRYDGNKFWEYVTIDLGLVMVIVESKTILCHPLLKLSNEQISIIQEYEEMGYIVEEFN